MRVTGILMALSYCFFLPVGLATDCDIPQSAALRGAEDEYIQKFTNYAPRAGGRNGTCSGGALARTIGPACDYLLENYLAGRATLVLGAATRLDEVANVGGRQVVVGAATDRLFGGIYRAIALERALNSNRCIYVAVADRYHQNQVGNKLDIATEMTSPHEILNRESTYGIFRPIVRIRNLPVPYRRINRTADLIRQLDSSRQAPPPRPSHISQ